jgi:multimeric flavodoxin WrbA
MHIIYDAVENNDVIVLATPIYFSGPSSIMKQVIDRFQCVWTISKGKKRGKAAALIAAGGSPSPVFANTLSIAKAFAMTIGADWSGELTIGGTDGMKDIPEEVFREAYSFGSRIAALRFRKV